MLKALVLFLGFSFQHYLLTSLIKLKVIQDACFSSMLLKNVENLNTFLKVYLQQDIKSALLVEKGEEFHWTYTHKKSLMCEYLLCISTIRYGFVLVVFKGYVPQCNVWNIFDNMPLHRKATSPPVLLPIFYSSIKINRTNHLC